ncbi:uncharacterized protein LOC141673438 [Apium graveolens]|uniref:uncharacterized protein LOC141673438 n=1 Tax=Apium graveolens TaxID=4045 RepID=UPI003D79B9EA
MLRNNLEGELPTQFASWSKIVSFNLAHNHFKGSIPPSIGNMSSLRFLHLASNNLEGAIPLEVAHFAKLEFIVLSVNNLHGVIPPPLYNISTLNLIGLDNNKFEGAFPANFGFTLPLLQSFFAGWNGFSGQLPQSIANASNLVLFDIVQNNIIGPVPINFGCLSDLQVLNLGANQLGDNQQPDDLSFFSSLVNCSRLTELSLFKNGLRGKLPSSIVNLSATIEMLDLFGNQIHGSIPREIGKLVNMTVLSLFNNSLTGIIPESVGELSRLGLLYWDGKNISGVIPTSISNNTQLVVLAIQYNRLQGNIPAGLFNISTLQKLYLTDSGIGGVIPDQIVGLSSQCVFLYLGQNLFTGPLPSTIGSFKHLVRLDVSNNKLTGNLPATLGECVMLEELQMEGNLFEGRIPISFKALKSLVILDLSSNKISGNIPRFFDGFQFIEFLNLSHNKLGGEVPKNGLYSNTSRFSIIRNFQLCGGIQALKLPACPVDISNNKKKSFSKRTIPLLVLLPLFIMSACLAFIFYRHRKTKQTNVPEPVLQDSQYPRLTYKEILQATNEFSPNNLLGEGRYGSVYRGIIESLEQTVAVKVLHVEIRGAKKSFLAECETLKNIRHRNLIKIITACSSTDFEGNDFKALVFEYMTNGSLDNWLHPSLSHRGNERNLTLLQRLNISIDVAMGVDYLYNQGHTKIIHCDIKPSNILLDDEFVARVGDFGLARFSFAATSGVNQTQTSSTGIRGTVGYVPPVLTFSSAEYGTGGEISAEGDVYSYGILLLEIFSGKRPTCSSILMDNCNNLHEYVKNALPHRGMDIDPRIVLDQEDDMHSMELCLHQYLKWGYHVQLRRQENALTLVLLLKNYMEQETNSCREGSKPG